MHGKPFINVNYDAQKFLLDTVLQMLDDSYPNDFETDAVLELKVFRDSYPSYIEDYRSDESLGFYIRKEAYNLESETESSSEKEFWSCIERVGEMLDNGDAAATIVKLVKDFSGNPDYCFIDPKTKELIIVPAFPKTGEITIESYKLLSYRNWCYYDRLASLLPADSEKLGGEYGYVYYYICERALEYAIGGDIELYDQETEFLAEAYPDIDYEIRAFAEKQRMSVKKRSLRLFCDSIAALCKATPKFSAQIPIYVWAFINSLDENEVTDKAKAKAREFGISCHATVCNEIKKQLVRNGLCVCLKYEKPDKHNIPVTHLYYRMHPICHVARSNSDLCDILGKEMLSMSDYYCDQQAPDSVRNPDRFETKKLVSKQMKMSATLRPEALRWVAGKLSNGWSYEVILNSFTSRHESNPDTYSTTDGENLTIGLLCEIESAMIEGRIKI